jgi:uncharacterized membrane protein HdeD (DUF308 family)
MLPTKDSPYETPTQDVHLSAARPDPENGLAGEEGQPGENRLWVAVGGLLLISGVTAFFAFINIAQVAGGLCSGALLLLAGGIFLMIGFRDRGEFSR